MCIPFAFTDADKCYKKKTLLTKTYQVWAMKSGVNLDCNAAPLTAHALTILAQMKMAYDREEVGTVGVALSCISITVFFAKRHYAGQKEANLCRNDDKHSRRF